MITDTLVIKEEDTDEIETLRQFLGACDDCSGNQYEKKKKNHKKQKVLYLFLLSLCVAVHVIAFLFVHFFLGL